MDYGHSVTDKELMVLEGKIKQEYQQASKEVEESMQKYLAQFEKNDAKMAKLLDAGDITKREYTEWRTKQMMISDKWKGMRDELTETYMKADKVAGGLIQDATYEAYAFNHNYGVFEAERGAKVDTNYTLYTKDSVARLVKDNPDLLPPPGKRTSEAIRSGALRRWNQQQIQSVMTQAMIQGKSIPKIAKDLAERVGERNSYSHIRAARTMVTSAENAGRLDSYRRSQDMGIEMQKQWMATHDGRTRHSHRDIDGETIPIEEEFGNGLMFPADPDGPPEEVYNCRCTLVAKVIAVDGVDISDIPDQTSEEWEEWLAEHE